MCITALHVANTVLDRAFKENVKITPMKLQKMIYVIYKTHLKLTDKKIFTEPFSAWKRGPVLPTVYSEFKHYRANPITEFSLQNDGGTYYSIDLDTSNDFNVVFNKVWDSYSDVSAYDLSEMTHLPGGAWDKAIQNESFILKDEDIKEEPPYAGRDC